eukprot:g8598.t1
MLSTADRDPIHNIFLEVSNCEELRNALADCDSRMSIKLIKNLTCSERDWKNQVTVAGNRVLEGLRSKEDLLTTHLNLSAIEHGIKLTGQSSISFKNLVIHSYLKNSTSMESLLSFVYLESKQSNIFITQSIIMSHSCHELPDTGLALSVPDNRTHFTQGQLLTGVIEGLQFCQSQFHCHTGKDIPVALLLDGNSTNKTRWSENGIQLQNTPDQSPSRGRNQGRRVLSISLICSFSLILAIVGLIIRRRLSKHEDNSMNYSTNMEEEGRLYGVNKNSKRAPYIVKLGNTSVDINQELGSGGFGTVYKGTYKDQIAAVKIIQLENSESQDENYSDKETKLSESFVHPNVVRTFDHQTTSARDLFGKVHRNRDQMCKVISMEYCDKGELSRAIDKGEYVLSFPSLQPNMGAILHSALDVAKGLEYLHSVDIVHGDLKPDNVLRKTDEMDPRGYICKICDFGLSRRVGETLAETDTLGMISYMPPELLQKGYVGCFTDIYSFGMLLWEIATSDVPFAEVDYNQIVLETVNGRRPKIPDSTPTTVFNLIKNCWDSDYTIRPNASQVISELKRAVSEWYSSFPIGSAIIPSKNQKTKSEICAIPALFLRSTFDTLPQLDEEGDWCKKQKCYAKQRPRLKARSYYEVHKQMRNASIASPMLEKKPMQLLTPLENESISVPPLFPYNLSRMSKIKDEIDSEDCCRSRRSFLALEKEMNSSSVARAEAKSLKKSHSSQDHVSTVSNSTPRSMLAGLSGYLRNNRFASVSLSGIDRNLTIYKSGLYSSQNIDSEASLCNSRMEDFEDV